MSHKIEINLDQYPQAAILVRERQILALNELARHHLPTLDVGGTVPEGLDLPPEAEWSSGVFCVERSAYEVRATAVEQGTLFLFSPAPDMGLTRLQLDSALDQMRLLMGEFLMEIGPYTKPDTPPLSPETRQQFSKSYHRMLRLMENMEYVNHAGEEGAKSFVDVVSLWKELTGQVGTLLGETETTLEFVCHEPYLMVAGDSAQLRRVLLGLLSNGLRAAQGGKICVKVSKWGNRVILSVEDTANKATRRGRMSILGQDTAQKLPVPGSGAGLGMEVVRDLVRRHRGTLLVHWDEASTRVVISLPRGSGSPYVSVQSPKQDRYGGFNELMVELSDVLPAELYGMESMD